MKKLPALTLTALPLTGCAAETALENAEAPELLRRQLA